MVRAVAPIRDRRVVIDADGVDRRDAQRADRAESAPRRRRRAHGRRIPSSPPHRRASVPAPSTARTSPARSAGRRPPDRRPDAERTRVRPTSSLPRMKPSTPPASVGQSRRSAAPCRRNPPVALEPCARPASPPQPCRPAIRPRPGAGMAGDAAAPGIGRLARCRRRVRQRVAGRHVHHHERIEHHLEAARLQIA